MENRTIFLSHSHKDIDKVRTIRNLLESLEYEPLLFYLKCLDDNNDQLEEFIQKEIESRNIFIYCKSSNSESSPWVQKELDYIRTFDSKRLYSIDIEKPLRFTLVDLLQSLTEIIKRNRVFISCPHGEPERSFGDEIEKLLNENGYEIFRYKKIVESEIDEHQKNLLESINSGIFLPIISDKSLSSNYCLREIHTAFSKYRGESEHPPVVPIYYNISKREACMKVQELSMYYGLEISKGSSLSEKDKVFLLKQIKKA